MERAVLLDEDAESDDLQIANWHIVCFVNQFVKPLILIIEI